MNLSPYLPPDMTLRLATANDRPFLLQLFSNRPVFRQMNLPTALAKHMVEQQYQLQQASYRQQAPNANLFIVNFCKTAVGQLTVNRNSQDIHLMDLSLMQQHQSKGIGTALIKALQAMASEQHLTVSLSVDCNNPRALALYLKLDFITTKQQNFYYSMVWRCDNTKIR